MANAIEIKSLLQEFKGLKEDNVIWKHNCKVEKDFIKFWNFGRNF